MEEFNDLNDFQDNSMDVEQSVINDMDDILNQDPIPQGLNTGEEIDIEKPISEEETTLGEVGHCGNVCLASSGWEHKRHTCGYSF